MSVRHVHLLSLLVVIAGPRAGFCAGEPSIHNLDLRGLQIGATTTIVLHGEAFGAAPRLLLPFPAKQERKPASTQNQVTFAVTLGPEVEPGYYHLRIVTDEGVSLPVAIAVDRLPQRPWSAALAPLPAAVHGTVSASTPSETRFEGRAGQTLLLEVEARRLGSRLRPVLHLYSPRHIQLGWAWPTPALGGDARLDMTLPENGTYTLAVHDAEYAPPGPSFFRLRVGRWCFVDRVFPPAVARGQSRLVELLGPETPMWAQVPATTASGPLPIGVPPELLCSGPRPFVLISPHAEVVKQCQPGKIEDLPTGRVGVSGRLSVPFAEARYRVPLLPKMRRLHLEVFAERQGSPLDAALVVRNEQGAQLARAEGGVGTLDPVLEYAVPAGVNAVIVGVVDAQGHADPGATYRLVIEPRPTGPANTGFTLFTRTQRVTLPVTGRSVVPVLVNRGEYAGRVALAADGLPPGVQLEGADIPEAADGALVTVERGKAPAGATVTRWHGRSAPGDEQTVMIKDDPLQHVQPWLASEIAVATSTAKGADFQVDWRGLPPETAIVPGTKLALPVKVTKPAGSGVVRLSLLTSQLRPLVENPGEPTQFLRLVPPVDLPAATVQGDLAVPVPAKLPAPVYDVTVQADLLGPDNKTVRAVAYAPVQRLAVRPAVVLRLDGPARLEAKLAANAGATINLQGKVERGFAGNVIVTAAGLPKGVRADAVTVKERDKTFTLKLVLPATIAAGEFAGIKVFGTIAPDAKQPAVRVRGPEVALTLLVRRPAK